jgi:hypothetical protein
MCSTLPPLCGVQGTTIQVNEVNAGGKTVLPGTGSPRHGENDEGQLIGDGGDGSRCAGFGALIVECQRPEAELVARAGKGG